MCVYTQIINVMITTVSSATDAFDDTVGSEDLVFVTAECGGPPTDFLFQLCLLL